MDRMELTPRRQNASGDLLASVLGGARPLTARKRSGCEESCDFCGDPIGRFSPEFEVEAELQAERWRLHFHSRCYASWWGARSRADRR
jgi:hypothetical protein